jgi:hypothetical protein
MVNNEYEDDVRESSSANYPSIAGFKSLRSLCEAKR